MSFFDHRLMEDGSFCIASYSGEDAEVVIPDIIGNGSPVTILYDDLFKGHSEIVSVHIPDTVTDMGEFLFEGCTGLKSLTLPSELQNLWGYTFCRCGIEEIVLPDPIKIIPAYAFKDCRHLKKVTCGSGLKKISSWAFGGCDQLTELLHGPSVEISPEAFSYNPNILEIQYE